MQKQDEVQRLRQKAIRLNIVATILAVIGLALSITSIILRRLGIG